MRNIPPALKAHLDSGVTTICRLLKITLEDGRAFGMTTLDRNVECMGLTYYAQNGFDTSIIATDASFGVDNGEAYSLYKTDIPGISADMVHRGELDNAEWVMYLINYKDLSQGVLTLDAGDVGEVRTTRDTVFMPELLSYAMRLRQSVGHVDSITCRAIFGTDSASQTGCGVNAETLWRSSSVNFASVDEPKVTFVAANVSAVPTHVSRWRLRWTSGDNASGRLYQVEAINTVSGQITLTEPLPFVVQENDQFDIRPDCDKLFSTCRDVYGNELDFKGENLIPVGQSADTPGAGIPE